MVPPDHAASALGIALTANCAIKCLSATVGGAAYFRRIATGVVMINVALLTILPPVPV